MLVKLCKHTYAFHGVILPVQLCSVKDNLSCTRRTTPANQCGLLADRKDLVMASRSSWYLSKLHLDGSTVHPKNINAGSGKKETNKTLVSLQTWSCLVSPFPGNNTRCHVFCYYFMVFPHWTLLISPTLLHYRDLYWSSSLMRHPFSNAWVFPRTTF